MIIYGRLWRGEFPLLDLNEHELKLHCILFRCPSVWMHASVYCLIVLCLRVRCTLIIGHNNHRITLAMVLRFIAYMTYASRSNKKGTSVANTAAKLRNWATFDPVLTTTKQQKTGVRRGWAKYQKNTTYMYL